MFDFDQPLLVAGVLLGLSSSLHCFGMCSGIAASLHFAAELAPLRPARSLLVTTLLINTGRISGYMIAGAIVGGLGSSVFGAFDHATAHTLLRWAAAVALGWIGLSMLDVLPLPAGLYRVASHVSGFMDAAARAIRLPKTAGLVLSGIVWGFLPCAMVYAALFYAMFSGSWLGGTRDIAGHDRNRPRAAAAAPPRDVDIAPDRGGICHPRRRNRERWHITGGFRGVVPRRLTTAVMNVASNDGQDDMP